MCEEIKHMPPTLSALMSREFHGPVTVGMSLDIASIDTISEINMVRNRAPSHTTSVCMNDDSKTLICSLAGCFAACASLPFIKYQKLDENMSVFMKHNLSCVFLCRITTTVACNMDLTKYPMDKQTCTLQLESWGYNINDVMFYWARGNDSVSGLDTLKLAQFTVEDHYTSVSEAVYETGNYPKLIFHFELKRSILYFILETYVPSSLLVVLSWVSFWISQSSVPARICIGVTTVLTMTTLMMGARTSLPNANCFIKAIDVYLGICFSFIFGALIEYAVAHFCTLQHPDYNNGLMYGHHMHECEEEMNGIVTTITSDSSRLKRRKDGPALVPTVTGEPGLTPSSPTASEPKTAEVPTELFSRCAKNISVLRKILRSINCCHVENPHYIDNYSRLTFPLSFIFVNLLYWTYYLYF
uniref:Uncharacterized protein n=1 Tax=Cyprinus carpio TaxID=7962 RepID=A0A8C2JY15_CYPCA